MGSTGGSGTFRRAKAGGGAPMTQVDDLSHSLVAFDQHGTLVAVLEMSQSSWLAAAVVPSVERRPLKKLEPDPAALLRLVEKWRDQATAAGGGWAPRGLGLATRRGGRRVARLVAARGHWGFECYCS